MQVFTPLSQLFNDPNTDYLRLQCAESCLCEDRRSDDDVLKKAGASTATSYFDVDPETGDPVEPDEHDEESVNGIDEPSNPAPLPNWVSLPPVHPPATTPDSRLPPQTTDTPAKTPTPVNVIEGYYVDPYWDKGVACNGGLYGHPSPLDCVNAIKALEDLIPEDALFDPYRFSYNPSPTSNAALEEEEFFHTPWSKTIGGSSM